jgi:hypothetical protein
MTRAASSKPGSREGAHQRNDRSFCTLQGSPFVRLDDQGSHGSEQEDEVEGKDDRPIAPGASAWPRESSHCAEKKKSARPNTTMAV